MKLTPLVLAGLFALSCIARADLLYLGSGTGISTYDTTTGQLGPTLSVNGLDFIRSIDFRPANGTLYALGTTTGQAAPSLFTINLLTGQATPVGGPLLALTGAVTVDMDFDPATDRIRIVSDVGANLTVDPSSGSILQTGPALEVLGVGYASSPGIVYGLRGSSLVVVDPDSGLVTPVGDTGREPFPNFGFGFDVSPTSGKAYGYYDTPFGVPEGELYEIDLSTAEATLLRRSGIFIPSLTVAVPEPGWLTLALTGGMLAFVVRFRRRKSEASPVA